MKSVWFVLGLGFLFLAIGCGPSESKKPSQRPNVVSDDSTVYGQDATDGRSTSNTADEEISEDPVAYTDYSAEGSVESNLMDLPNSGSNLLADLEWEPIYFDFDQSQITDTGRSKLRDYARYLLDNPNQEVLLEGHCDSRGTDNYNLALGERRAQSVKRYFVELGVSATRIRTISYGELRPQVPEENEAAWARNRRVSFAF